MIQRPFRILATLSIVLLLQSGCGMVQCSQQASAPSTVTRQLVKTTRSWNSALLPEYPQGQPEITILRISIPPGTRLDTHTHPVINAGVLLTGQFTVVTADGKVLHLKAGDPIVEVVNTWHYGINEGNVPAEIIVVYAGIVNTPITVVEQR
ncbi:MAG TPA: cupin domain-containing protein [Syntrophorhabdales bacterium]|nr:cupin domain-containing protein [Syntrophorhabdales bacterium]